MKPIWQFSVHSSNRGDQAIQHSIEDLIRSRIDVPIAHFSCMHELLNAKRIQQLNREASMLLIGSAGLYSNYPLESGWYFRCKPENFKKIQVPIVLFAIGCNRHLEKDRFGPLRPKTLESIKAINEQAVLSGVRDYRTLEVLGQLGIKKASFVPDPGMFLHPSEYWSEVSVGINIAQHCRMLEHYRPQLLEISAKLCWLLDEKHIKPIFIAHDCLEHSLYLDLKKHYPNLTCYNENKPREMMGLYHQLLFNVAVRCHSNIMSFGAGTPFISLMYDQKQVEFLKVIGFSELGIKINSQLTFNILKEKVNFVMNNLHEITIKMRNRKHELKKIEDNFVDQVVKVLQ